MDRDDPRDKPWKPRGSRGGKVAQRKKRARQWQEWGEASWEGDQGWYQARPEEEEEEEEEEEQPREAERRSDERIRALEAQVQDLQRLLAVPRGAGGEEAADTAPPPAAYVEEDQGVAPGPFPTEGAALSVSSSLSNSNNSHPSRASVQSGASEVLQPGLSHIAEESRPAASGCIEVDLNPDEEIEESARDIEEELLARTLLAETETAPLVLTERGAGSSSSSKAAQGATAKSKASSSKAASRAEDSTTDYRVAEGRVFKPYQPRRFEVEREHGSLALGDPEEEEPAPVTVEVEDRPPLIPRQLWQRDCEYWPLNQGRLGLDFHGVVQIKKGGRWLVPVAHLEIIQALQQNHWAPVIISWVGSNKREHSTREEIRSSGLERLLGPEGVGWHITRDYKSQLCKRLDVTVFIDDNTVNLDDLKRHGVYTVAIHGREQHEDGYSNLAQALALERILYKRPLQDR